MEAIVQFFISQKYYAEKVEKLMSEREEMNEASLDASRYKGDIRKFLESLPEDKVIKILGAVIKEEKEIQVRDMDNPLQDLVQNQDATDRGRHCPNNLNDVSMVEKEKQVESFANPDQPAIDVDNAGHQDLENQVADNTGHNILKNDLSSHHAASEGQVKQQRNNKKPWEFPGTSQEPQSLTQRKDSRDQQLPLESARNDEDIEIPISSHQLDDSGSTSSSAERLTDSESDEELSDSKSSSVDSSSANCDSHPGSTVPIQAYADNNRTTSPRPIEHVHTSVLGSRSRDWNSAPPDSHRSSRVQDAQNWLPGQPNLQRLQTLESCNAQLTETLCNYSQVALHQANRETQNIQGTACSNCDALQEEKDELEEQLVNLEEQFQQSQEQIAAYGPPMRDQEYQIRFLKHQRDQLLTQNASYEETVQAQHEDKEKDKENYKKIRDFFIERIKKLQDDLNMANKMAYEFAQKSEEEFDALQKTMQETIEVLQKKFMTKKEEKEMERNFGQGNMHQRRGLRTLQQRLGLRFFTGDVEGNNLNPQQDDIDEVD